MGSYIPVNLPKPLSIAELKNILVEASKDVGLYATPIRIQKRI